MKSDSPKSDSPKREAFEQHQRPTPLEDPLGRQVVARFCTVPLLGSPKVDWQDRSAAAPFLRPCAVPRQEVLQRRQQERPKPSTLGTGSGEIVLFQKPLRRGPA